MMNKKGLLALVLGVTFCIPVLTKASVVESDILSQYATKSEKELTSYLQKLDSNALLKELTVVSLESEKSLANNKQARYDYMMPIAAQLYDKRNEYTDLEILQIIKDTNNTVLTQELMVELYNAKESSNKKELKKLLQGDLNRAVKEKIIINTKFDKEDITLLKNLFNNDDDSVSAHSLKQLSRVDSFEAYNISKDILNNYKANSKNKVNAALSSLSRYFRENKNNENEKDKFIKKCVDILNTEGDEVLRNSSIYALADLIDKDAIVEVINTPHVDNMTKVICISENYSVLKDILLNNPSESDIENVLKAMDILPIKDLASDIEKVQKNIKDKNLLEKCMDTVKHVESNGVKANLNWIEN